MEVAAFADQSSPTQPLGVAGDSPAPRAQTLKATSDNVSYVRFQVPFSQGISRIPIFPTLSKEPASASANARTKSSPSARQPLGRCNRGGKTIRKTGRKFRKSDPIGTSTDH